MSSVACCKSDFATSVAIEFNLGVGLRIGLGLGVVVRMRMLEGARAGRGGKGTPLNFLCLILRHDMLCALLLKRKLQVFNVRFLYG